MITPYKFIHLTDGIIFLFVSKEPANGQSCMIDNISDEPSIVMADYAIPIKHLRIDEKTKSYTIYIAGSEVYENEAIILGILPFDEINIGKLLVIKSLATTAN